MSENGLVPSRLVARSVVILLALAVIVVPTVMRSRQHVELRDTTRLSIRLNWQSDTPPQKHFALHDSRSVSVIARASVDEPIDPWKRLRVPETHSTPQRPFDNAPESFRGPPALFV